MWWSSGRSLPIHRQWKTGEPEGIATQGFVRFTAREFAW